MAPGCLSTTPILCDFLRGADIPSLILGSPPCKPSVIKVSFMLWVYYGQWSSNYCKFESRESFYSSRVCHQPKMSFLRSLFSPFSKVSPTKLIRSDIHLNYISPASRRRLRANTLQPFPFHSKTPIPTRRHPSSRTTINSYSDILRYRSMDILSLFVVPSAVACW